MKLSNRLTSLEARHRKNGFSSSVPWPGVISTAYLVRGHPNIPLREPCVWVATNTQGPFFFGNQGRSSGEARFRGPRFTESPAVQYKSFLICTARCTARGKVVLWSGSAGYLLPNRAKPSLRLDKNCRDVEASCRCTRQSVRGANRLRLPLETSGVCVSASPEISSVRLRLLLSRDLRAPGLETPWSSDAHPPGPSQKKKLRARERKFLFRGCSLVKLDANDREANEGKSVLLLGA